MTHSLAWNREIVEMRMRIWTIRLSVVALVGLLASGLAVAADWPGWRGPDFNGASDETGLVSSWSPDGENLLWKAEFIGRSTPVIVDGRACFNGRVGEGIDRQEIVACFDAVTGEKLWEDRFNVYNTTVPFNRVGWASLAADAETGYIFAHGVAGQLICYDRDGNIVWERVLNEEFGRLSGYGGRTQTPIVDGDQLILSSVFSAWGKLAAPRDRTFSFDKRTGEVLWISSTGGAPADMNTQSVPVVAEIKGRRMLISGSADGYIDAVDVASGESIWRFRLSLRGINSSVIVVGDRVYASHSEENVDDALMGRMVAIDATGSGDVTKTHEIWRINQLSVGFPSPTYHAGRIYTVDNSANLYSIDAESGKVMWEHSLGTVGKGSPVYADGKLYVTEVNGGFHILKPGADGVELLDFDQLKVPDGRYAEIYGSPAISNGRIYFSTEGGVYCLGNPSAVTPAAGSAVKAKREATAKRKPVKGEPAVIRVVPAEVLIEPGQVARFDVRGFDATGGPVELSAQQISWSLAGLKGGVDGGALSVEGGAAQAGEVVAQVGGLKAVARVRVIPPLPWFEDFESIAVDGVPGHWIGAPGKWKVAEKDGSKVLVKTFRPTGLLRNETYFGPSSMSNFTIEADVQGGKTGRRLTDVGLIANGYTLDLRGNAQRLQIRDWESENRIKIEHDFPWEMGVWYHIKLRVDVTKTKALVRGKVWPRGEQEPAAWNISVEDPHPIESGSAGLVSYSPADAFFDNLKVTVND